MSKKDRQNTIEKIREIDRKLAILNELDYVQRVEWIRPPDKEHNLRFPDKARISNWDNADDFYHTYNNSDEKGKRQLFNMTRRILMANLDDTKPFFKKTLTRKIFNFQIIVTLLIAFLTTMAALIFVFAGNKVDHAVPIYLILALTIIFVILMTLYVILKMNRIRWYKNEWIRDYVGTFWSQRIVRFALSKELTEFSKKMKAMKSFKELDVFPKIFTEQDFLNFRVMFYRDFHMYDQINPSFKYTGDYNLISKNFLLLFGIDLLLILGAIAFLVAGFVG